MHGAYNKLGFDFPVVNTEVVSVFHGPELENRYKAALHVSIHSHHYVFLLGRLKDDSTRTSDPLVMETFVQIEDPAIFCINWASSGGGGETRSQEHLCGAVANGGGGENGDQEPLRGSIVGGRPAQSVDTAAGDAMRVVVAAACAVGVIPSAHKRKRGRPKGSKNKQKPTSDGEPTCKRGCPAGSKASPKRSLAQAMDHFQDNVPPVKQPALTPSQSLPGETSAASASVMHSVPIEASVPPSRSAAVQHSASPSTSSAGTPRKSSTRPPLIPAMRNADGALE
ncbi:hypothetical protein PC120_g14342 [Phytophthora cactorum]|nr:hypothetical protein PC120_g14342 [Phytophthora cactorum]